VTPRSPQHKDDAGAGWQVLPPVTGERAGVQQTPAEQPGLYSSGLPRLLDLNCGTGGTSCKEYPLDNRLLVKRPTLESVGDIEGPES